MSVKNASGFTVGEILLAKKVDSTGFQTEYILVNSASLDGDNSGADEVHGRLYVTRGYGSGSQGDFVGDLVCDDCECDEPESKKRRTDPLPTAPLDLILLFSCFLSYFIWLILPADGIDG